ncbi:hypothetical protein PB1_03495 [Bacillus methanolicus PB1]|uniref:Uncharacterized protein n=1 Tax=Bacillus methanolicus PB1 TaxID=997296 RepID=I3E651_BACMT|nr:hypothetical protein PB1_03495 [Bacillus methanolicus PB1]
MRKNVSIFHFFLQKNRNYERIIAESRKVKLKGVKKHEDL